MAWSNSKLFTATVTDLMNNTTAVDANSDTFKIALYTGAANLGPTTAAYTTSG